jgi:hypothetical protein
VDLEWIRRLLFYSWRGQSQPFVFHVWKSNSNFLSKGWPTFQRNSKNDLFQIVILHSDPDPTLKQGQVKTTAWCLNLFLRNVYVHPIHDFLLINCPNFNAKRSDPVSDLEVPDMNHTSPDSDQIRIHNTESKCSNKPKTALFKPRISFHINKQSPISFLYITKSKPGILFQSRGSTRE